MKGYGGVIGSRTGLRMMIFGAGVLAAMLLAAAGGMAGAGVGVGADETRQHDLGGGKHETNRISR